MPRKTPLLEGEYYHVFNRGVEKRTIFQDQDDFSRFMLSMTEFNTTSPIGSIYEHSFQKKPQLGHGVSKLAKSKGMPLVEFVAYCLNKNHFHFILKQVVERGIEKFMHKLSMGFAKYFNERYKRSGSLFQGPFKSVHIESNEQLLYVGAYVNLNNLVHGYYKPNQFRSSWHEYTSKIGQGICNKDIILGQFNDPKIYLKDAEALAKEIKNRRDLEKLTLE